MHNQQDTPRIKRKAKQFDNFSPTHIDVNPHRSSGTADGDAIACVYVHVLLSFTSVPYLYQSMQRKFIARFLVVVPVTLVVRRCGNTLG